MCLSPRPQRQVLLDNIRRGDSSSNVLSVIVPCSKVREKCSYSVNFFPRSLFVTLQSSLASHRTQWCWRVSRPASSAKPTATQSQKSTGSAQKGGLYLIAQGTKPPSMCSWAGFTPLVSMFTSDVLPASFIFLLCNQPGLRQSQQMGEKQNVNINKFKQNNNKK